MVLQGKLKGEVKPVLEHFRMYEENYEKGWDLLECCYNNRRALTGKEIYALLNYLPITQKDSGVMRDALETLLSAHQNLKESQMQLRKSYLFHFKQEYWLH